MKFCEKCGSEIAPEIQICTNCGCAAESTSAQPVAAESKKSSAKKIMLWIAVAVAVVLLTIGGLFLANYLKVQSVDKQLMGSEFLYREYTSHSLDEDSLTFDYDGNCKIYSHYYSVYLSDPIEYEYTFEYEIFFENSSTYVRIGSTKYRVVYEGDEIVGLKDPISGDVLERK